MNRPEGLVRGEFAGKVVQRTLEDGKLRGILKGKGGKQGEQLGVCGKSGHDDATVLVRLRPRV